MLTDTWERMYRHAHQRGLDQMKSLNGVACLFHSVIDGFIRVTPELIKPILERDPGLKQAALEGCQGNTPVEIYSPQDFIKGLFYSLHRGSAMQRMIRSRETFEWAMQTFGSGEYRLGGTSGNMARSLVPLGIPITVYANPLTVELAELFGDWDNLTTIVKREDQFKKLHPLDAAEEKGIFAIHWIFEYNTNFKMILDGKIIQPPRANRYIPSWNPRNNQFKMNPDFAEGFLQLADTFSHLLFSGFHILSDQYPDGTTCVDVVEPLSNYLKKVRKKAPHIKIHLELASIASPKTRKAVLDYIAPQVDSVGLNETELPLFIDTLNQQDLLSGLTEAPTTIDFCRAIKAFMDATRINRLHFHNLGYYICLEKEPWHSPEDSRDSLLFAAIMAASRAENGLFSSIEDVDDGLNTEVCQIGLEQLKNLSEYLNQPSLPETGIGTFDDLTLTMIPSKLVNDPLFTVGLGYTISSGAFLTQ